MPSLQALAKNLERSKNKDTISQHLKQKDTAKESGVNIIRKRTI